MSRMASAVWVAFLYISYELLGTMASLVWIFKIAFSSWKTGQSLEFEGCFLEPLTQYGD